MRANATHHEGVRATARLEVERLKGELAAAKLAVEEARLRQLSPDKAGRAQGSGMHMMMDTPVVGGGTALVGCPMGDRAVGSGIPMTPMRGSSSQDVEPKKPPVEGTSEGLTAIAQQISGPPVYLTGSLVTPAQVRLFVEHTRTKLRARTFLMDQLDADIDKAAMQMIELKIVHSKVQQDNPGQWRKNWDVDLILRALEEVYAVNPIDKCPA